MAVKSLHWSHIPTMDIAEAERRFCKCMFVLKQHPYSNPNGLVVCNEDSSLPLSPFPLCGIHTGSIPFHYNLLALFGVTLELLWASAHLLLDTGTCTSDWLGVYMNVFSGNVA